MARRFVRARWTVAVDEMSADIAVRTPLRIHNLDTLGLPFLLLVFAVLGVGVTSFVSATQAWRRHLVAGNAAPATLKP